MKLSEVTQPGWYWVRRQGRADQVVCLERSVGDMVLWQCGTEEDWEVSEYVRLSMGDSLEVSGPLQSPWSQ